MYKTILRRVISGEALDDKDIFFLIDSIREGRIEDAQIAGFLVALLMKGVDTGELVSIAKAMRNCCVTLHPQIDQELMDTCGTGGGLSTINISTATAILCSAAGIAVAKHGSRSISSLSGSADVLEALDIEIELTPRGVERMIERVGFSFIYAPLFHPVMCRVLPVESVLGIKTIFYTIIGPLISPASAPRHLLGVYEAELQATVAEAMSELGFSRAMVVHGLDGIDEISLLGKTRIIELDHGSRSEYEIEPEDFGLQRCTIEDIASKSPKENARMLQAVFDGEMHGHHRNAILLNSAGGLMVGGKASSFPEGIALAAELIDSGRARYQLDRIRQESHLAKAS
jgi:anthranilate phosphoribosyltransferase